MTVSKDSVKYVDSLSNLVIVISVPLSVLAIIRVGVILKNRYFTLKAPFTTPADNIFYVLYCLKKKTRFMRLKISFELFNSHETLILIVIELQKYNIQSTLVISASLISK